MTLTAEQQQDVREILAAVFSDDSFKSPSLTPTDETLALTETLLVEIRNVIDKSMCFSVRSIAA